MEDQYLLLFKSHEERDVERFEEVNKSLKNIEQILKPISEAFTSVSMLGRWGFAVIVIISMVVGVFVSLYRR